MSNLVINSGVIVGGRVTQYLLEKSRIVTQATEERNYHVFYELLAGLDQQLRDKYGLLKPDKYFYLNQVIQFFYDLYNNTHLIQIQIHYL